MCSSRWLDVDRCTVGLDLLSRTFFPPEFNKSAGHVIGRGEEQPLQPEAVAALDANLDDLFDLDVDRYVWGGSVP
jgi:hypothetical protein